MRSHPLFRKPRLDSKPSVRLARIEAGFDAAEGDSWTLKTSADGVARPDLEISRLELSAQGTLDQTGATRLTGSLVAGLRGLALDDAALQQAIGEVVSLAGKFDWTSGGALDLDEFGLRGEDYTAELAGRMQGLDSGFELSGAARVDARDIARFSGLAGRRPRGCTGMGLASARAGAGDRLAGLGGGDAGLGLHAGRLFQSRPAENPHLPGASRP